MYPHPLPFPLFGVSTLTIERTLGYGTTKKNPVL
jgi:hypothetical protein